MTQSTTPAELRSMRIEAGLSQERLARLADYSLGTVRLLESGYAPKRSAAREKILALVQSYDAPAGQGERAATSIDACHDVTPTTDRKAGVDDGGV